MFQKQSWLNLSALVVVCFGVGDKQLNKQT